MIFTILLVALLAVGSAEPTPQPSVEPTTASTTSTTTTKPSAETDTKDTSDLAEEGQDQVAILKQINRVNEDGSYTFGYEAADGSFKIETRDVAGNVKGMFGFVDEGGELRRVSYSASNGTGFQSTGAPNVPPLVTPSDGESTTRINLLPSSTTENPRLPIYIYGSSTVAPRTTPEVIQHIPKVRPTPGSLSTEPTESEEFTTERRPVYGLLLPQKSSTPNYITLRTTTPSSHGEIDQPTRRPSVVQLARPRVYKKIVVTKRPVDPSTTLASPVTTTFYPVQETSVEDTPNEYQREVDSNSITENGLAVSGTEDSPDVYGGSPTGRPFPGGVYRNVFPQIPQYQRILQSSAYLQNQNPYLSSPVDPRLQQAGPINPYVNSGVQNQLSPDPRYKDPSSGRIPGPGLYPVPGNQGPFQSVQSSQIPFANQQYSRENYGPYQVPVPFPQNAPQGFRLGFQQPQSLPPYSQGPPQQGPVQQPGFLSYPQFPPQGAPPIPRQPAGQTLPTPTPNPSQGLLPVGNPRQGKADEDVARSSPPLPPQPPGYNPGFPNIGQYSPEQPNTQMTYFMEQLLRMLIAAQSAQQQPPPQQLSPFQQALLSVLGPNNAPQDLFGRNYDPRYYPQNPSAFQQRQQYDPRYSPPFGNPYLGYQGYQDPYSQYRPQYNPYFQSNPYTGYSPNPYYQGTPEQALLQMFLGSARYPAPVPQTPIPQIQQSPAAFDRSQEQQFIPRQQAESEIPNPASPVFGRRIPLGGGNIVQRSSVYSKATTPSSRSHGSRNVQILDDGAVRSSEATPTTSKPR